MPAFYDPRRRDVDQVLAGCGEPTTQASGEWVYQREGQFPVILRFDSDGNVQSITDQTGGD
jgi:hypothetical protein